MRPRSVVMTGLLVAGVVLLVFVLATTLYEDFGLPGLVDLVWKVLVLLLLADISAKLGSRNSPPPPGDLR